MKISKKLDKLINTPIKFFLDTTIIKKKFPKIRRKFINDNPQKNDFLHYQNLATRLNNPLKSFWDYYLFSNNKFKSDSDKSKNILIIPTGDVYWDSYISDIFFENKLNVLFYDIWTKNKNTNLHIDELLYFLNRNPSLITSLSVSLFNQMKLNNINTLILPNDTNNFYRYLAKQASNYNVKTILIPYIDSSLEKSISNFHKSACSFVFSPFKLPKYLLDYSINNSYFNIGKLKEDENNSDFLNHFSVEQNDTIISIFLPAINTNITSYEPELILFLEKNMNQYSYDTHIFIISSNRVPNSTIRILNNHLSQFYKKTILFQDDFINISDLLSLSSHIFSTHGISSLHSTNMLNTSSAFPNEIIESEFKSNNLINSIKDPYKKLDIVVVPDTIENSLISQGRQKYLNELLNFDKRMHVFENRLIELLNADFFLQWGAEPSHSKTRPEFFRTFLNKNKLYVEDGFIRSIGLWTNAEEPTLSIVMDTKGVYYDATKETYLEELLNSDLKFDIETISKANKSINYIVENKISKYNYAPKISLDTNYNKRKILLVDQKVGDMSLKYGLADASSFERMLEAALSLGDEVEIYIKQHPCGINNPNEAHYTNSKLGEIAEQKNVHLISYDINPYSLINAMDEVFVVSSGMGFEALMAGKPVTCFGAPFYSNWGLTTDKIIIDRRTNTRSLAELFHIFYNILSVYVSPVTGNVCTLDALLSYIDNNINSNSSRKIND